MTSKENVSNFTQKVARAEGQRRGTFLTGLNVTTPEANPFDHLFDDTVKNYYEKLTGKVTKLDSMIDTVLSKHEKEFMAAFKVHMHQVYAQLAELKKRTDEQEQQMKTDAQVSRLQQSMDWFRDEAMKLKDQTARLSKDVDKWKSKAITLEDDRKFLENQLKSTRRENKLLKIALSKSTMDGEQSDADSTIAVIENRRLKPPRTAPAPMSQSFDTRVDLNQGPKSFCDYLKQKYMVRQPQIFLDIEAFLMAQEKKFQGTIMHAKNALNSQKKRTRAISAHRSHRIQEKNDLESLFLQCVDEVKKDMIKRRSRSQQSRRSAIGKRSDFINADKRKILELFVSNEQVLVMLYEMLFPHKASKLNDIIPRKFEPHPPTAPKPSDSQASDWDELLDPETEIN